MAPRLEPLSPQRRFFWALLAWLALAASQPGVGRPQGFGHTAFVCLAPWALFCCRPGRRAFLAEWLAAAVGLLGLMVWMRHLFPWLVPLLALIPALYHAASGFALRRLARRYPLALAAPAAWMLGELLRWYMPPPLSFGWWRLGTFLHDTEWITGSTRVFGVWGLSWICAAFAGWLADLWRLRGLPFGAPPPFPTAWVHLLGLGPLGLGIALTALVPAPPTRPGPRVLLVQPGIEQELKRSGERPLEVWAGMVEATAEGLAKASGPVDLVCWGETMFPFTAVAPGVREALAAGKNLPPYAGYRLTLAQLDVAQGYLRTLIGAALFGHREGLTPEQQALLESSRLPDGVRAPGGLLGRTAFITGAPELVTHGEELRHRNAALLWAQGRLLGSAGKVHLVPAAEDPGIWVELPWIPGIMARVGGFVPDFVAARTVEVLEVPRSEGGDPWRVGASICYDQVFDDPYAARAGDVDFHLVLSNEAWYRDSLEMDHMVAFARLDAISTGRAVVRATNSGVSCVLDPEGKLLGVIEDGTGRRKMVAGELCVQVPVPVRRTATPWARSYRWQPLLWALLSLGLAWAGGVTGAGGGGSAAGERGSAAPDQGPKPAPPAA